MDRLQRSEFLRSFGGQVFRSHYNAVAALAPEMLADPKPAADAVESRVAVQPAAGVGDQAG